MVQITAARPQEAHQRSLLQKRRILEAASRVFRRRGLHATGMRHIAAELGMHVGNLYYYFRNKQELLAFCQQDALSGLQALAEETQRQPLAADQKLARLIEGHVELVNETTPGSLAHLEVEALEAPWRQQITRQRDAYERCYRRLIEEGIASGLFRPVEPKVASMAILGALNWTVKWYRSEGGRGAREIGAQFAELLVGGLQARSAPPRARSAAGQGQH